MRRKFFVLVLLVFGGLTFAACEDVGDQDGDGKSNTDHDYTVYCIKLAQEGGSCTGGGGGCSGCEDNQDTSDD